MRQFKDLNSYFSLIEKDIKYNFSYIQLLEHQQEAIEGPWPILENSFHILLMIEL